MVDHNTLEDEVTVWDPKGLRTPWHVVVHYKRGTTPGARIDMWSCEAEQQRRAHRERRLAIHPQR